MERSADDDDFSRDRENDFTQLSNYSPQDSPRQEPTRRHYDEHEITHDPYRERRQGSIIGDESQSVGGNSNKNHNRGRAIAEIIERRWKGKNAEDKEDQQQKLQRPIFLSRPSMGPESHRKSFVERIEVASQNMLRRSSSNADALIDKLSDALNAWSTGMDETAYPDDKAQQKESMGQSEESRFNESKNKKMLQQKEETDSNEEIPLNDESPHQQKKPGSFKPHGSWPSFAELFTTHPTSNQVEHQEQQQEQQKDNHQALQLLPPSGEQQQYNSRRLSWTERAFSFLFNRSSKKPDEWGTQPDVEVQGSDQAYDDIQGSFKLWSFSAAAAAVTTTTPFSSTTSSPSPTKSMEKETTNNDKLKNNDVKKEEKQATKKGLASSASSLKRKNSGSYQLPASTPPYRREFLQQPNIRLHNESLPTGKQPVHHAEIIPGRSGSIEQWPTESYAKVARRSMTDTDESSNKGHHGRVGVEGEEEEWFECDPESGRVKVPPLSVPHAPSTTSVERNPSISLYDTMPHQQKAPATNKSRKQKNKQEKNKYHVVHHKKHPEEDQGIPDREPRFDSDFENWIMTPESNTYSRHHKESWPDSYQIKDENRHYNDRNNMKRQSLNSEKNVWVAQADAMD
ncbi:hypothetical protein INT45_012952 [Circinella minor]|uniref:Uncharacterized protein n=1 Tax=Circinella minor TaxID=1195481 RepID=A0A8H7S3R5_9FUNG|nr:hypothetical protein INT45_012952 [Circinella minor]